MLEDAAASLPACSALYPTRVLLILASPELDEYLVWSSMSIFIVKAGSVSSVRQMANEEHTYKWVNFPQL